MAQPHNYQISHIATLQDCLERRGVAVDVSDTGTGKSFTTIELAKRFACELIIIAPKFALPSWLATLAMFDAPPPTRLCSQEALKVGKYYASAADCQAERPSACPFIRGGELINIPPGALVVFDEAHKFSTGVNRQIMLSVKPFIGAVRVLMLSATMLTEDCFHVPAVLLGVAQLGKHAYRIWVKRVTLKHFITADYGSGMVIGNIRQTVDADLFAVQDIAVASYDMGETATEIIEAAYAAIDDSVGRPVVTAITEARMAVELAKVEYLVMLATQYVLADKRVAIFVNFVETTDALQTALNPMLAEFDSFAAILRGGQTNRDRAYFLSSFQSGRARVVICTNKTGGTSISLHGDDRVGLILPPPSIANINQVVGRLYRAGCGDVIQRFVFCAGPEDKFAAELRETLGIE